MEYIINNHQASRLTFAEEIELIEYHSIAAKCIDKSLQHLRIFNATVKPWIFA